MGFIIIMLFYGIIVAVILWVWVFNCKIPLVFKRWLREKRNKNESKIDASLRLRQEFSDFEKRLESKQYNMDRARKHAAEELNWILGNEPNHKSSD